MKNDLSKVQETLADIYQLIIRYRVTIFIIFAGVILSVMLIDITRLSSASPSATQVTEAEKSVKVIQFKQASIDVINSLKENNIEIDTLFDPNRYDPFN